MTYSIFQSLIQNKTYIEFGYVLYIALILDMPEKIKGFKNQRYGRISVS
ncbi:MAG TPA: hypothetical protein PL180_14315 [Spirochaetota bacterium]|nr:hypothetical protein [Spirochaetota bacterium]HRS79439.1 hypothetical protein [Spirochaetota bacterium]HRT77346.1 hypothetical protein [Spirochaetota bacterium]